MRFEVRFVTPFTPAVPERFIGRGVVHALETAIIFEGPRSTMFIPGVTWILRPVLAEWSILTVPYQTIVEVKPPRLLFGWNYHVHFRDVHGARRAVGFRVRRTRGFDRGDFLNRVESFRKALISCGVH